MPNGIIMHGIDAGNVPVVCQLVAQL
jgi:hypothetical protein